ncbi:MAG TPA: ATP-binding protein [Oligoflexus sp.]|uniref:ATP-binding protein n=1 Tax=Oligoflexus sp. TaxID=1971216 RepID=UPI002D70E362|nr:ATP-binding protein [Oligoflexus sp.]HYX32160.1 ATP-binding protein [Oligoflexus sp.]
MEKEFSSTLLRQLKRCKIDMESPTVSLEVFREFLGRVDTTYEDFKERESRYEQICRQSSDEIATYISKLKQAEAINRQQQLDILNMLRHIKQGIFTITEDRLIHPEYSIYTTELLEKAELAGCDVKEVLLQKAAMDRDSQAQILSVLDFAIGSDEVGFCANQHILPRQLVLNFSQGHEKTVEVDWTPIFNDADVVEKILVSLRDVSEIRLLEQVNLTQQKELEILSQLMSTSSGRFEQFHRSSIAALDHCQAILNREGHHVSIGSLQELYRDLHTIKGNARMFGFRGITNLVHEAEEAYKISVHVIHDSWNTAERLQDLELIRSELEFYAAMANKAFGYSEKPEQMQRYQFVEHTLKVLRAYQTKECTAETALQAIADEVRVFEYSTLDHILENVLKGSAHLALELGKLPPQIHLETSGLGFHRSLHGSLESIFNHLIRNALDHGLETEVERLRHGKPVRGSIDIRFDRSDRGICISVQDDGRGLNLTGIRGKAQSLGLLTGPREFTAHQLALLIFEPGLSTRQEESQVSGRGIGMYAVRSLIQSLKGDIHLELNQNLHGATSVRFAIELPNEYVTELTVPPASLPQAS